jgi:hypothetical protein
MLPRPAALALAIACAACSDAITCDGTTADLGDLCLPGAIAPGIPTTIDVSELCGRGCTDVPSCKALPRNGQVILDVQHDVCSNTVTRGCLNQGCLHRVIGCVLPALPEGDHVLIVPGGPSRLLRVRQGGQSSCRFPSADGGVQ